jgi:hypothetical protein
MTEETRDSDQNPGFGPSESTSPAESTPAESVPLQADAVPTEPDLEIVSTREFSEEAARRQAERDDG